MSAAGNGKPPSEEMKQKETLRVAVVVVSEHHNNTLKIAEVIANAMEADLLKAADQSAESLKTYDCVVFGSGIYFGKHHRSMIQLAQSLTSSTKTAIVFSTAGLSWFSSWFHRPLRRALKKNGCHILGEFCCRGWDTVGPLFFIGGINRSHPNRQDLKNAQLFATRMSSRLNAEMGRISDCYFTSRMGHVQTTDTL